MTITALTQVYGVRLTRHQFFKYLLEHPEHIWSQKVKKFIDQSPEYDFKTFVDELKNRAEIADGYMDIDAEVLYEIIPSFLNPNMEKERRDDNGNYLHNIEVHELTHDVSPHNDIIVGITVTDIKFHVGLEESVFPENNLPWAFSTGYYTYNDQKEVVFNSDWAKISNFVPRMYVIQNDCACCS